MKIYAASSWRNEKQPEIVALLRSHGHEVYDIRNPAIDNNGFHWSDIDPDWKSWTPVELVQALNHPVASAGFALDWNAMCWADAGVLIMPCGRSAHLEAGFFVGAYKPLYILLSDGEPELMYKMATAVCTTPDDLVKRIAIRAAQTPSGKCAGDL